MAEQFDKITEPQEWIDRLVETYSPNAHDIDCALQNMGLKIKAMEDLLMEANNYLNTNDLTSIGHGRILHKKIQGFC